MKSLSTVAVLSAAAAWVLWQVRPPQYQPFAPASYDSPYLVFAFQSALVLAALAALLCGVLLAQKGARETLLPWSSDWLVKCQLLVLASAVVTGMYGVRLVFQVHARLGGPASGYDWYITGPAATLALSPWIFFIAAAAVSAAASRLQGAVRVYVLAFDVLTIAYLAFVFAHIGYWACVDCSGPIG